MYNTAIFGQIQFHHLVLQQVHVVATITFYSRMFIVRKHRLERFLIRLSVYSFNLNLCTSDYKPPWKIFINFFLMFLCFQLLPSEVSKQNINKKIQILPEKVEQQQLLVKLTGFSITQNCPTSKPSTNFKKTRPFLKINH